MKILLVTQQDDVRRMLAEVTGARDELLHATDIAAGLATMAEHDPALALVDMTLAGGAALAMVHHVLASSGHTAVYALAAPPQFEAAAEALSLGAAGLVVAPPTGDSLLRIVTDVQARLAAEERATKLMGDARDAVELGDAMTQAVVATKSGDVHALGDALVAMFLVASGAHGVAIYGEEEEDGMRRRIAAYGTALELPERYGDLELAQVAAAREAEVIGLAATAHLYGGVLLDKPIPARSARIQRATELATALMPLFVLARAAVVEEATAPRSRALPLHVFERLVDRDAGAGPEAAILCTIGRHGEVDMGPLGPALAIAGAAVGLGDSGEAYVLLPKTSFKAARGFLLDVSLPLGMAFAPADGLRARHLLEVAHARAKRSVRSQALRELRQRPLPELIDAVLAAKHPTLQPLDGSPEAVQSAVMQALRHGRALPGSEMIEARGADRRESAFLGLLGGARRVTLSQPELSATEVVLVLTPRASWGLVVREQRAVHTSDALLLELLRARTMEAG